MNKAVKLITLAVLLAAGSQAYAQTAQPSYNFGDFRSSTLTGKAWEALNQKDLDGVLAYTNKVLELYGENARAMQADLKEYPAGDNQKIFSYWALNDVATSLYIQGEAYRQAGKNDKAKEAFEKLSREFTFGQAWDPSQKLFWKPAEAANDKLKMMESGLNLNFGDMSSSAILGQAWSALNAKDYKAVKAYVEKMVSLYGEKAKEMQASLKEYPWESKEKIFSNWALNDVGTAYFVLGEAYRQEGKKADAAAAFQKLINEYFYAQCWDPQGWFWKPAEAAQQKLIEMEVAAPAATPDKPAKK